MVNAVRKGFKLVYAPADPPPEVQGKARVSLVLVPAEGSDKVTALEPVPARGRAEWTAPFRVGVIGIVFGPQGLDHKRVESLVVKDRELMAQMADYAEQTAQVESLVTALAAAEQRPSTVRSLDDALTGFAAQSGTALPKLDRTQSTDQQAMTLLRALNPALSSYDPLAPQQAAMRQSAGLAASVAALFFGSNVGLAAGGAAMLQNLRTLMFPGTDFRSALAQSGPKESLTLCARRDATHSRTRLAYLWAYRLPNTASPAIKLVSPAHLPLGLKSTVRADASPADWTAATHARDWALVTADNHVYAIPVQPDAQAHTLELDLKKCAAPAGAYRLQAKWDWDVFDIPGEINLHALRDLKTVSIPAESRDRLVEGAGPVRIKLQAEDLEFVERLTLDEQPLQLVLASGIRGGTQPSAEVVIDTERVRAGVHQLALYLPDGSVAEHRVRVLPPNPKIANAPLRVNLGESRQTVELRGTGLDRIERIEAGSVRVELGACNAGCTARPAQVQLPTEAQKGDRIALSLGVEGLEAPVIVESGLEVAGPRPRIEAVCISPADDLGVALAAGEAPAGSYTSISLRAANVEGPRLVRVACRESEKTLEPQALRPGERRPAARLDAAGPETLFLSLDSGAIGQPGCTLEATIETDAAGRSDPHALGNVVRLPRIEAFALTDEKIGDNAYGGVLTGYDLEIIGKAGWDPTNGTSVDALPRPVAGQKDKQTLRIVLPWPAPSPHALLYIWLRGETAGRLTRVRL